MDQNSKEGQLLFSFLLLILSILYLFNHVVLTFIFLLSSFSFFLPQTFTRWANLCGFLSLFVLLFYFYFFAVLFSISLVIFSDNRTLFFSCFLFALSLSLAFSRFLSLSLAFSRFLSLSLFLFSLSLSLSVCLSVCLSVFPLPSSLFPLPSSLFSLLSDHSTTINTLSRSHA
jgi:hypothetical protein